MLAESLLSSCGDRSSSRWWLSSSAGLLSMQATATAFCNRCGWGVRINAALWRLRPVILGFGALRTRFCFSLDRGRGCSSVRSDRHDDSDEREDDDDRSGGAPPGLLSGTSMTRSILSDREKTLRTQLKFICLFVLFAACTTISSIVLHPLGLSQTNIFERANFKKWVPGRRLVMSNDVKGDKGRRSYNASPWNTHTNIPGVCSCLINHVPFEKCAEAL